MLTKEEIMEVFLEVGCKIENQAKDENWFFYTREGIHYEVQIDIDTKNPDNKIFVILCPYMGKVDKMHGYLLACTINMIKRNLKDRGIDQYQLDYDSEDCTAYCCMAIYYKDYSKQDLHRAIVSAFKLDDYVNEVISNNIRFRLREEDNSSVN
ncbi:MAG: hypothetical protein KBS95_04485 [Alistipes sp.]|nr:hypothetical protein [Candidatus Alistipes equi]